MTGDADTPTLLERAHGALRVVTHLGQLEGDDELQMIASGNPPGKVQTQYLRMSVGLAIVDIAESLHRIADHLEYPDGRPR